MNNAAELERIGKHAVEKLRKEKLTSGHSFMINSNELPGRESYREYPDGTIKLVITSPESRSFTELRTLSADEAGFIRSKFSLG
ncbi:MAG: hypothetical protein V4543_09080 [Bacteroidota bacterium]